MLKKLVAQPLNFEGTYNVQQVFSVIANQPWSMWLDSCDSQHVDSRYDILVWQPEVTLTTDGQNTDISFAKEPSDNYCSQLDPLQLIKQEQQKLFSNIELTSTPLPFKGGAVGYFAYDLGKRFETIRKINKQDINTPDMAVGLYQQAIIYDRNNGDYTLLCFAENYKKITHFFQQALKQQHELTSFELTQQWRSNMSKAEYQEKFQRVQSYLRTGDCYQINLAQRFTAEYQGNEFSAYCALRAANKAPFSAFIRFEESTILSISPERFLQLNNDKVQTKPIKGTRPRSNNKAQDQFNAKELQHASKDRAENLMIVDLLRNDISKACQPGSVKVPSLFAIESFPAVHHLVSTVEGKIRSSFDGSDLLRGAFPGGSITGAPKIRAMEIIEELEPHQRNVYCGSIGYLSACGNMDTSITIRTLVCHDNKIHCWAGGGLVADSNVESEYQETYDKVNKILPILSNIP